MQHWICQVADDMGLTYQIHTGLQEGNGNVIYDSNPALLTNLFLEYANVKFDIDMCWGHIISPEAARRTLVEWLDAVPANKISAFGGDYCFVDGVYGHQVLARQNVAAALATKVADGSFGMERATELAKWMFVDNPLRIFGLAAHLPKAR